MRREKREKSFGSNFFCQRREGEGEGGGREEGRECERLRERDT